MRFLVVTMHAGEPQFERCIEALRAQQGVEVQHVLISDLPNLAAHARCYEEIQTRSAEYDVAAKLDADMVLSGERVLERIGRWFLADPDLDHAQLALHDFFTDRPIMGLQVFSSRVRWLERSDGLFVDAAPLVPGRRIDVWEPQVAIADHAPDPTLLQAFRFGIHRAQKAFQWDRRRVRGSQARDQWRTLVATWNAFDRTRDVRRGVAVYGADIVWRGQEGAVESGYHDAAIEQLLDEVPKVAEELHRILARRWRRVVSRELRHGSALGLRQSGRYVAAAVIGQRRRHAGTWDPLPGVQE